MRDKNIDPVTVEIVGNLLLSISEEMGAALIRSAYSSNIKERKDCSTAVFNAGGEMVAQAEHIPMHLGSMLSIIEEIYNKYDKKDINEGDMYIANDPYSGGGTHLPDITIAAPVFVEDEIVAWVANIAHHSDVGGKVPGSTSGDATSIFQEGVRIPIIKFVRNGEINGDVRDYILVNCRTPKERKGDLQAQVAANKVGVNRMLNVYKKYGSQLNFYMEELLNHAEKRLSNKIEGVPDGKYVYKDFMDNDGINDREVPIEVEITVRGKHMELDFSKSSRQVSGPINVTYNGLLATVFYSIKSLIDPDINSNAGIYRVFDVIAPEGSIVNACHPAAVGERIDTCMRVVDVIIGAMAEAIPERVIAACNSACTTATFSGIDPRSDEFFVYLETIGGGSGASSQKDGMSGVQVHLTNTSNLPIEALEIEYPLLVEQYSLRIDSGGGGEYRGGLGIRRDIKTLASNITFSALADRQKFRPWGLKGGEAGKKGAYYHISKNSKKLLSSKVSNLELEEGDIISVQTPGSGGFGKPEDRIIEKVKKDIIEGKISIEEAKETYGLNLE